MGENRETEEGRGGEEHVHLSLFHLSHFSVLFPLSYVFVAQVLRRRSLTKRGSGNATLMNQIRRVTHSNYQARDTSAEIGI